MGFDEGWGGTTGTTTSVVTIGYWSTGGDNNDTTTTVTYDWPAVTTVFAEPVLPGLAEAKAKSSREAQRSMMLANQRPRSVAAHARHGHQQLARLPCYRGVRTR